MGGLDNILATIRQEGEAEVAKIREENRCQVEACLAEARNTAEKEKTDILEQAGRQCAAKLEQARSGAEAAGKKALLAARTDAVRQVVDAALETLCALPAEDYFEALLSLIRKHCPEGGGALRLSAADQARMPAGFLDAVNQAVSSPVTLGEPAEISGGFLMQYGDILQNCSFDALLEDQLEEIKLQLHQVIFA